MTHDPMEHLKLIEDLECARDYRRALERVRRSSKRPETLDDELRQARATEQELEKTLGWLAHEVLDRLSDP